MENDETRPWTGEAEGKKHEHILGQMRTEVQASGRHIVILLVYRNAIDMAAESPVEVEIGPIVYGETYVPCNIEGCYFVGVWHVGNDVMREFGARKKKLARREKGYVAE